MSAERDTTADDFKQSMFARIRSLDEGLDHFDTGVEERWHVCGETGGCEKEAISVPHCYLLAHTVWTYFTGGASDEEREEVEAMSLEECFGIGRDAMKRMEAQELADELRDAGLDVDKLRELGIGVTVIPVPDELADELGI